jgi:hydroxyacylglutathione hydrolase
MVYKLEYNPFGENTYIISDDSGDCVIIDPGCYLEQERQHLAQFVREKGLNPVRLLNTHCHLDHVFGNGYVHRTWGLGLEIHEGELPVLDRYLDVCRQYGIPGAEPSPQPNRFLQAGEVVEFGSTKLEIMYTPGHSPASVSFYNASEGYVIAGDVLFMESIGRTDLPGGNHELLLQVIRNQFFILPPETIIYPGHGPATTIRHEKEYNPFL